MKRWAWVLLLAVWAAPGRAQEARWLDQSYEIFLNAKVKKAATSFRDFPLFWWNFLVLESAGTVESTLQNAEKICERLAQTPGIRKLPCRFSPEAMKPLAESWISDTVQRRDLPPPAEFKKLYEAAMGKAALPLPRELLEWIRRDPLNELEDLKQRIEMKAVGPFERRGPFMFDPQSGRVLVPVQFDFPPTESARTKAIANTFKDEATLFGAHAGTMENEFQIRDDVDIVSLIGTLSMALLIGFIVWSRRYRLILLFPLMGVGLAVAATLTVLVFGKIHAISLSFGPGLVGLAMDYGIHAAFLDPRSKPMWRSNFMALLTSLVIMVLLAFSSIPLLRQMMFFSIVGLTLSYFIFYWFLTRYPATFAVEPFQLKPRPWLPMEILSVILVLGTALIFIQPLKLGLEHLNFQSPKTEELRRWFVDRSVEGPPYNVRDQEGMKAWAEGNGIRYEGMYTLIPEKLQKARHQATWAAACAQGLFRDDPRAAKFFAPFETLVCAPDDGSPAYLSDYTDGKDWTAVLFPHTEAQAALIRERYPDASSPRELIAAFPKTFAFELGWMLPIALVGAFLFLLYYYRHAGLALLACVPFAAGVGAFALMTYPLNLPVTFISLMGLLMVFGFSLDYGIFAVDYMLNPHRERLGVWSALTLCAVTTVAGFTPMATGHHPVLHSLGHALLWGSIGTYIGTFWGVPAGYRWLAGLRTKKAAA